MPFLVLGRRLRCKVKESSVTKGRMSNAGGRQCWRFKDGVC